MRNDQSTQRKFQDLFSACIQNIYIYINYLPVDKILRRSFFETTSVFSVSLCVTNVGLCVQSAEIHLFYRF